MHAKVRYRIGRPNSTLCGRRFVRPNGAFVCLVHAGLASSIEKVFHGPSERIASSFEIPLTGRIALPRTEPRPFGIPPPPLAISHGYAPGNATSSPARGEGIAGLDEFGLPVASSPADGSTRFICAFVDNTRGVGGDVEAQIWVVRSKYGGPDGRVGVFESACVGLKEGEVVLDLAFYSTGKLAVLLADEVGRINEGAVGGGTPEEEEGVRSSLLMISYVAPPRCSCHKLPRCFAILVLFPLCGCRYEELNFAPLPPEVNLPGAAPPWLTGFSDFNATALEDALKERRNVGTMTRRSPGGRGGRAVAMGGARGLGCVITGACGVVLLDMEDVEEEDDEDDDDDLETGGGGGRSAANSAAATRAMQLEEDDVRRSALTPASLASFSTSVLLPNQLAHSSARPVIGFTLRRTTLVNKTPRRPRCRRPWKTS